MMLDATQQFSRPLTKDRLFDWHAALFPAGRSTMRRITVGDWRTLDTDPMQVGIWSDRQRKRSLRSAERKDYYAQLVKQQSSTPEITIWLE